jgi:NADPH:quinone reductase-like Zn-dependent oxidoreductase
MAVEARNLAPIPEGVDDEIAAALPLAGLTAWQGLFVHGKLIAGQRVLIHGAAGGTGAIAVQLAKDAGAHVIATGRKSHESIATELGADGFVDVEGDGLDGLSPVDLVFDTIGGSVLDRSAGLLTTTGTLVSITAPPKVSEGQRALFFVVEPNRDELVTLAQLVGDGRIRPTIGASFPLEELREAFLAKHSGIHGKVVIHH